MNAIQIQQLRGAWTNATDDPKALPQPRYGDEAGGPSFSDTLKDAVGSVNEAQQKADGHLEAFVAGRQENLHEVMIAMNEARVQFQLMTEVRNKILDTYQELMRMQV